MLNFYFKVLNLFSLSIYNMRCLPKKKKKTSTLPMSIVLEYCGEFFFYARVLWS